MGPDFECIADEGHEPTKDWISLLVGNFGWLRHQPRQDQFEDTTEFWNPIGMAEKMLDRKTSTTFVAPREELVAKLMLTPNIEGNFYTTELAIQVLMSDIG